MLVCGHDGPAYGDSVCIHLRMCREPTLGYIRWYTGSGMAAELLCLPCAEDRGKGLRVEVAPVCEECFEYATVEVGAPVGIRGAPGILVRTEPLDDTLVRTTLPMEIGTILDAAPIEDSSQSRWLLLTADQALVRLDADTGEWTVLARIVDRQEPEKEYRRPACKARLHVSRNGEYAAVVHDFGQFGQVIDLQRGEVTLLLDGGDYHEDTVPFSFAFAHLEGRTVAVHRTRWNRLDISDPATGALLTPRELPACVPGKPRPEHALDYFHGALQVSPRCTRIFDDGWVWHPVGVPMTWSLERWLFGNVWESEHGPTVRHFDWRAYYWGAGGCWIDEHTFALAGIGDDEEMMIDGARIFEITTRHSPEPSSQATPGGVRELIAFPGPSGRFFSDGTSLFSSGETGLSRWNPRDGARTGHIEGFRPTHHHRTAGELVRLIEGTMVRWRSGTGREAPASRGDR